MKIRGGASFLGSKDVSPAVSLLIFLIQFYTFSPGPQLGETNLLLFSVFLFAQLGSRKELDLVTFCQMLSSGAKMFLIFQLCCRGQSNLVKYFDCQTWQTGAWRLHMNNRLHLGFSHTLTHTDGDASASASVCVSKRKWQHWRHKQKFLSLTGSCNFVCNFLQRTFRCPKGVGLRGEAQQAKRRLPRPLPAVSMFS